MKSIFDSNGMNFWIKTTFARPLAHLLSFFYINSYNLFLFDTDIRSYFVRFLINILLEYLVDIHAIDFILNNISFKELFSAYFEKQDCKTNGKSEETIAANDHQFSEVTHRKIKR